MTLFWRLFLSIFAALLLTGGSMAFISHTLRDIPSSDIDPGGAAVLGRSAGVVSQVLEHEGLAGLRDVQRRRLRPLLFEMDGEPVIRAPHFVRQLAEQASPGAPKVWINQGQVLIGPALITFEGRPIKLFLISRAPKGSQPQAPFGLFVLVGTFFAALLSYVLTRIISRRIKRLKRWSQELAVDLNSPAPAELVKRRDELGELTRALGGMAEKIECQLEAQRALTRMVSHEVRTPLTRLKLVLDLMERSDDPKALLQRAHGQIHSLDGLLEQMLTLSRLEANAWAPEIQREHWSERFRGWSQEWREQAQESGVEWQAEVADDLVFAGDETLMHVALDNLVRNALSLSSPGQQLSLAIKPGLEICLQDQAGGIPEDQLASVLDPFVQGTRASGSTGLGLPIASQIARLHGGQLRLENHGEGLQVRLTLPGLSG